MFLIEDYTSDFYLCFDSIEKTNCIWYNKTSTYDYKDRSFMILITICRSAQ